MNNGLNIMVFHDQKEIILSLLALFACYTDRYSYLGLIWALRKYTQSIISTALSIMIATANDI